MVLFNTSGDLTHVTSVTCFPTLSTGCLCFCFSLRVLLVHSLFRFVSAWDVGRNCLDSSSFSSFFLWVDEARVHAEFWRETLMASELLLLSSLLDCSPEDEDTESYISRGKYENLKARDIFEDKIDFCFSFQSAMLFSRRFSASTLVFSLSRFLVSLISSSNLSSSSILRKKASRLLFSNAFASSLFFSSLSSSSSLLTALSSSFSVISFDSETSLRFSASFTLLSL